ncbi:nuclear transport factor 2 family protein [Desulfococcaceae bacterium HSG9]|nr:nuclear transport factor 2 family protein [Desulfococcaceae bacterium HSG9]
MVNKNILIGIFILIAGVAVYYFFFYENDEKAIKKRFDLVAENVSKDSDESKLVMIKRLAIIERAFTQNVHFKIENRSGEYSSREIARRVGGVRSHFTRMALKFYDINIDLQGQTAAVMATARITGLKKNGEQVAETRELEFGLQKKDGDWFIATVKAVEVLEK